MVGRLAGAGRVLRDLMSHRDTRSQFAGHAWTRPILVRCVHAGLIAGFVVLAALGAALGCLTTLAPNIRARDHHRDVRPTDDDDECLTCHEAELAAQKRLMAMSAADREEHMQWMSREGGAALVAQWMIDDSRGCLGCHVLRGAPQ